MFRNTVSHRGTVNTIYLNVILVKGYDGSKVEERQIEVKLEQLQDAIVPFSPLTVLQGKAHTAQYSKSTATIEQYRPQLKRASHKASLQKKGDLLIVNMSKLHYTKVKI